MSDLSLAVLVLAAAPALCVAYGVRVVLRGEAHYERVDRMGGSVLLSKRLLEMGYWALGPVARACLAVGVTADALTWLSLALAAGSGVALAQGRFGLGALAALVSALCDVLDGLVARLGGTASDAGEVLDAGVDRYADFLFLAGVAYFYRQVPWLLVLSLAAVAGSFMVSYATAKAEALGVEAPRGAMRRPERAAYLVLGALLSPFSIRWLEPLPSLGAVMALPMAAAVALVAVVANASAVRRLAATARSLRARNAIASGPSPAIEASPDALPAPAQRDPT